MHSSPLTVRVQDMRTSDSQHQKGYGNPGDHDVRGKGCSYSFIDDSHRPRYPTSRNGPRPSSPEPSRRESSRASAGFRTTTGGMAKLSLPVFESFRRHSLPLTFGEMGMVVLLLIVHINRDMCMMTCVESSTTIPTTISDGLLPTHIKCNNHKVQAECNHDHPAQGIAQ
jgi:hypothetical protein